METLTITAEDLGKTFEVGLDEPFRVMLRENPTTGYRWAVHTPGEPVVEQIDTAFLPAPEAQIGGGGMRVLTLRLRRKGEHAIYLKRWREWQGDASAVEWFDVTIRAG